MDHALRGGTGASVPVLLILLLPSSLNAQGRSHGYVSLGAGATDLNGGLDWVIAGGPIGIGGEVGAGWVFFEAITGSYHFLGRQPRKHDLFATVGYAGLEQRVLLAGCECRRRRDLLAGGAPRPALRCLQVLACCD